MSKIKCADHKTMVKILKKHGFIIVRKGKHDRWTNGKSTIHVPNNHNRFCRPLAERLLKEAGIND